MTSTSKRVQRVERELLHALSQYLLHQVAETLPCFASITSVHVNPNMRHARVFFRLVGDPAHVRDCEKALVDARSEFQRETAALLKNSKFTPVLRFEFGSVPEMSDVDRLLENLHKRATAQI